MPDFVALGSHETSKGAYSPAIMNLVNITLYEAKKRREELRSVGNEQGAKIRN